MRIPIAALLAGSILLTSGIGRAAPARDPAGQLAETTAGRIAGTPVDCLNLRDIRSSRIIDGIAIVYETDDGTIYVNRPASGAAALRSGDVLVTDTHSPQLCSVDIVRLYDDASRMQDGAVGLGQFVPYAKAGRAGGI